MKEAKQVIVMRKDLNMRKGKMVSQGAHASLGVILKMMKDYFPKNDTSKPPQERYDDFFIKKLKIWDDTPLKTWLDGPFTKITVYVNSEEELLEIYEKAGDLPKVLIEDRGLTEFNDVLTKTCIAIGPAWVDDIDKITKHLKLL